MSTAQAPDLPQRTPRPVIDLPAQGRTWWLGREHALRLAANAYGVTTIDLVSQRRPRPLVHARTLFVWACRRFAREASYAGLGRFLGGRDHTSIIYLDEKAAILLARDAHFAAAAERIEALVAYERNAVDARH